MMERLTAAQAARVRKGYREAYAAEDYGAAIRDFWLKFEALYGVSRDTLRAIVDVDRDRNRELYEAIGKRHQAKGALPAKRKVRPRPPKTRVPKNKGLTDEDAAKIRAAYRDAYMAENPTTKIDEFYAKYTELYGLSTNDLSRLAVKALSELHSKDPKRRRRQKQDLKQKSPRAKKRKNPRFAVERRDPTGLEAANVPTTGRLTRTTKSVQFFRGGLPGQGKR